MNRLAYYLRAKNRYNLHSPFVFDFYCNVLTPKLKDDVLGAGGLRRSWKRNVALCCKIADYYGLPNMVLEEKLSAGSKFKDCLAAMEKFGNFKVCEIGSADDFWEEKVGVMVCKPENFSGWMESLSGKVANDTVFVIPEIHGNVQNEALWLDVRKNGRVVLSLDVFYAGLVFFRKELSRQDFLLL